MGPAQYVYALLEDDADFVGGRVYFSDSYGRTGSWIDLTSRMDGRTLSRCDLLVPTLGAAPSATTWTQACIPQESTTIHDASLLAATY